MDEFKKMLDANPRLALTKWTTTKDEEKVTTNKGGQRIQINGKTAYQIALGDDDTEMAAMLKARIVKMTDEKKADAQYMAQFPEKWEKKEKERWAPLFTQLEKLIKAIRSANRGDITASYEPEYKLTIREESEVALVLANYRKSWDAILNEVVTGRHYNPRLLQQAFQIYDDLFDFVYSDARNPGALLFSRQGIGYAERHMPANYVQAFCDGFDKTVENLEKDVPQSRSFKFKFYDGYKFILMNFYPLDASRLGFDFALDVIRYAQYDLTFGLASVFKDCMDKKQQMGSNITKKQIIFL